MRQVKVLLITLLLTACSGAPDGIEPVSGGRATVRCERNEPTGRSASEAEQGDDHDGKQDLHHTRERLLVSIHAVSRLRRAGHRGKP